VKANGGLALSVNCELSSLAYWPERENLDDITCRPDPENEYEVLRSNAVFADAASAALVGDDDDWRHPEILDTETHTKPEYADELGFEWRNGRLRVILSRRVPDLAPLVVKPAVWTVLNRNKLDIWNINWWVIHAAGLSVIDNIGKALGLPEGKLSLSRETLRLYGNTSSTSVGITGKRLMSQNIRPGDYVAMLSVGPGMSGGCSLFRFPFAESKK
jgi:predicted naringenin-chalcone synthase